MLLKFGSLIHSEALFNEGQIYMNTVRYFQKLDKKAVGDRFEGVSNLTNIPEGKITMLTENKSVGPLDASSIQIRENIQGSLGNIYSMFGITTSDIEGKQVYRFPKFIAKQWTHCVMILDNAWFVEEVAKGLTNLGFEHHMKPVDYIDMNKYNGRIGPFHKTDELIDQNEFRVFARNPIEDVINFRIGPLGNKAKLVQTKDLVDDRTWIELK